MRNFGSADSSTGSVTSEAACFWCVLLPYTGEGGIKGVRVAASSIARFNAARLVIGDGRALGGTKPRVSCCFTI
jgi:hypothetical protein